MVLSGATSYHENYKGQELEPWGLHLQRLGLVDFQLKPICI